MIVLSGADLVLPDRILRGTVVIEGAEITEIGGTKRSSTAAIQIDLHDHYLVPGFIDVHVHGVEGHDSLEGPSAIEEIAARLPRYGVTAFCPTTVACDPKSLRQTLESVRRARAKGPSDSARVLPAHLESNFISPEYRGAQPTRCLRQPPRSLSRSHLGEAEFTGADILAEIERAPADVGVVTLAPELEGGVELTRRLVAAGHRVALGHSGASFDQGLEAIAAGARHATHLFNRMRPISHRDPGLAGAVLYSEEVAAELICDGRHVHPAMLRVAIAAKHPDHVMAISDGTAGAGLPVGARARLGDEWITVGESAAYLDDGTMAGSVLTMEGAFRVLVGLVGLTPVDAAILCSTTPARELGLHGHGVIAPGAVADLAVLSRQFAVVQTYVAGRLVFSAMT